MCMCTCTCHGAHHCSQERVRRVGTQKSECPFGGTQLYKCRSEVGAELVATASVLQGVAQPLHALLPKGPVQPRILRIQLPCRPRHPMSRHPAAGPVCWALDHRKRMKRTLPILDASASSRVTGSTQPFPTKKSFAAWWARARANPLSLGVWHFTLRFVLPGVGLATPSRRPKGCGVQSPLGPKVYPKFASKSVRARAKRSWVGHRCQSEAACSRSLHCLLKRSSLHPIPSAH